ncbi:MAG: autotransporter-associated beta strand repeat-containing protein [Verrucomicrobiota bacterium]
MIATGVNSFGTGVVSIGSGSTVSSAVALNNRFTGTGTLTLTGNINYTNAAFLNSFAGTVNVNTPITGKAVLNAAGQTIGAGTTVNIANGTTFYLPSTVSTVEGVTFNLNGAGNTEGYGELRLESTLGAATTVNLLADSSIGAQSAAGTINGTIAGSFGFAKLGGSILYLTAANSFSGTTNVNAGTLTLSGAAGALANTSAVTVSGGTLISGTTADAATTNRINSAATLTLGGTNGAGTFTLTKPTAGTCTQTFASLTLGLGASTINNTAVAGAVSFTAAGGAGYTRNAGGNINFGPGTVVFTNAPTDATGVSVTNSGTAANDILIGAILNNTNSDFVAAAAGTVAAPTYATNVFASGSNTNITSATLSQSGDTQSIRFGSVSTLTISSGTSTITSGGILNAVTGTVTITGGAIQAGSGKNLWISGTSGANFTINSAIVDNNTSGLEKYGGNTVTIGGNNSFTWQIYASGGTLDMLTGVTYTISAPIVHDSTLGATADGGFTKTSVGKVTLTGASTYTGATIVSDGALVLSGSLVGTTSVGVNSGATLSVTGFVNTAALVSVDGTLRGSGNLGAVTVNSGGTFAPGDSVSTGVQNLNGDLNLNSGAHLSMRLTGATGSDQVVLNGSSINLNADSAAGATLDLALSYVPVEGDTLYLVLNGGSNAIGGFFNGYGEGSQIDLVSSADSNTYSFMLTYTATGDGTSGNDIALLAVPEPSIWVMMLGRLSGLAFFQRMRRRSKA